ncbi:MFS transporter [Carbonactinospora thermoautotrophica]|uniref:MFS transporter n=1 Tax=Carbonactinospora thermoautotrophica TaxID=1469144 RepID=UPI00082D82D2|nr:MFS transporter [Carbonactinospora thermoautotrophica]
MDTISAATGVRAGTGADPRRWLGLVVMIAGAAMDLIDVGIVTVAIPSIQRDIGAGGAAAEWIVAGYALAFGVLLVTGGRLGDTFGYRRMYLLGITGFVAASLCCGLAPDPWLLVIARFAQGASAAVMTPQILSMVRVHFPAEERAKAYALFSSAVALAMVAGPLVGGLLVEANLFGLDWRAIFLINLPIGVVILVAAHALLPEYRAEHAQRLDLGGVAILSVALLALLYPLVEGHELGWPWWSFLLMAASVPMLAVFAWYEGRRAAQGGTPLIPLALFHKRGFTGGVVTQLVFYSGVPGLFLVLTLTLQAGFGFSALHAGLTFLPWSLGIACTAGPSAALLPKLGRRLPIAGAIVMTVGMTILLAMIGSEETRLSAWQVVPGLFVAGLGMGFVVPTLVDVALSEVDRHDAGTASGSVNTAAQIGGATGVAAIGLVFFSALTAGPELTTTAGPHFASAFRHALWYEVAVFVLSAVLMLLLPKKPPTHQDAG